MTQYRTIPEDALKCYHVNEEERQRFLRTNRPYHEYTITTNYFRIINRTSIDTIEGYIGKTDWHLPFFTQLDNIHSYFIDYQKREKVYFTFDGTTLYELISIMPGNPLLLTLRITSEKINNMENKIENKINIHAGDGNTITTGNHNTIAVANTVIKNDLDSLKKELIKHKVATEDIEEIVTIVQAEKPDIAGNFGPKTKGWLQKMLNKSIDGTWQVGIATAGGLLVEILKTFFGS